MGRLIGSLPKALYAEPKQTSNGRLAFRCFDLFCPMRLFLLWLLAGLPDVSFAQFSLTTDVSVLRNSSPRQQFWTAGQTIRAEWYPGDRGGPFVSISYFLTAEFTNSFTATAKSSTAGPATIPYTASSSWQFRQAALGWKHYFRGTFKEEKKQGWYGLIGTGLLFARIDNRLSQPIDTSQYFSAGPTQAKGTLRRITLDLGLGGEWPIGADIYAFGELRSLLQASETPSALVAGNSHIPLTTSVHAGLRVLIW